MDTIYLSSALPRVPLTSEDDLSTAAAQGLLEESHFLDLKREIKPGKGGNRELARDLASFAVDGGTLLVGLEEQADGSVKLVPQSLAGLSERVEQVAAMIPDAPLAVVTRRIPCDTERAIGYLVVHVPASPAAPHMVDSRYLGRGDKTKRYLSDPEVFRLHEGRRSGEAEAAALLEVEFDRDPIPGENRRQAHLFLVAEPLSGRPSMLLQLTDGVGWEQRLLAYAHNTGDGPLVRHALATAKITRLSPDIEDMTSCDRRPGGAALTTFRLGPGRLLGSDTESVAELEVYEDGGLRMFTSRLSYQGSSPNLAPDADVQLLFDTAPVIYARRLVALTLGAAQEAGYFGNWALAAGATGLRGCHSLRLTRDWPASAGVPYSGDVYRRAVVASYAELTSRAGHLADRLVGPLLRGFGTRQEVEAALVDPAGS